jgi:hypothetical protein
LPAKVVPRCLGIHCRRMLFCSCSFYTKPRILSSPAWRAKFIFPVLGYVLLLMGEMASLPYVCLGWYITWQILSSSDWCAKLVFPELGYVFLLMGWNSEFGICVGWYIIWQILSSPAWCAKIGFPQARVCVVEKIKMFIHHMFRVIYHITNP